MSRRDPKSPKKQFSGLSLGPVKTATVDDDTLEMDGPVRKPEPKPMPGNVIDSRTLELTHPESAESQAELPLRKALARADRTVYTNHFAVKLNPNVHLFEYKITGLPPKMTGRTARSLVREAINNMPFLQANRGRFATNYKEKLISWIEIEEVVPVPVRTDERRTAINIGLQWVGMVDTQLLQDYSSGSIIPTQDHEIRVRWVNEALNMIVSSVLDRSCFSLKENKFFLTGGHTALGLSLCAIRGYYYSIRPGMGQILLNLNACTSAFYQPILVSQFLRDQATFPNEHERLAQLQGLRVQVMYVSKGKGGADTTVIKAQIKTILGTGQTVRKQKFMRSVGEGQRDVETTVESHLFKTYGTTLNNPHMPAINCGTEDRPLWYPPEKLKILPYQIYKRCIPDALGANMLEASSYTPQATRALIEHEGLRKLGLEPGAGLRPFAACPALQIDSRMLEIPSTTLPYPKPMYNNGPVVMNKPDWNLANRKFFTTDARITFKVFMIGVPCSEKGNSLLRDPKDTIWNDFHKAMQTIYRTATIQDVGRQINSDFGNRAKAQESVEEAKRKGANFVMLLLEKKSTPLYSIFKDLADCQYGMQSLCIVYTKRLSPQYWGNVAMKINLKAGGINHTISGIELIMKDTLVLGADVTHAGPGSLLGTPSVAAVVGSVSQNGGKFLGSMRLQPHDNACEVIQDLKSMVVERLRSWFYGNGRRLPKNIIYYRDGVGDSQYFQIKDEELPQIRGAFANAAEKAGLKGAKFSLTALVVGKRHNVKLFPKLPHAMPKNGNCLPGTLVDTIITSPYYQDFYLQSHNAIKGTAKPAHYFAIVNEMGLSETDIQEFTHKLCYTYVRATMGVSYAPPAYYADRLCERGRCYLRDYFAPTPNSPMMDELKLFRVKCTHDLRVAREQKYRVRSRNETVGGRRMMLKCVEEIHQEELDLLEVDKMVKARTFQEAKTTFYKGDVEKNPWHDNIAGTMFWM